MPLSKPVPARDGACSRARLASLVAVVALLLLALVPSPQASAADGLHENPADALRTRIGRGRCIEAVHVVVGLPQFALDDVVDGSSPDLTSIPHPRVSR